jgi:hypothetical protein
VRAFEQEGAPSDVAIIHAAEPVVIIRAGAAPPDFIRQLDLALRAVGLVNPPPTPTMSEGELRQGA